jgi:hypothetical protein
MGEITFMLAIGKTPETQIAAIKAAIDAQITAWNDQYPTLTFQRGKITWNE